MNNHWTSGFLRIFRCFFSSDRRFCPVFSGITWSKTTTTSLCAHICEEGWGSPVPSIISPTPSEIEDDNQAGKMDDQRWDVGISKTCSGEHLSTTGQPKNDSSMGYTTTRHGITDKRTRVGCLKLYHLTDLGFSVTVVGCCWYLIYLQSLPASKLGWPSNCSNDLHNSEM